MLADQAVDVRQVLARHWHDQDLHHPVVAFGVGDGHAVVFRAQGFHQGGGVLAGDDAHDHRAQSQLVFQQHADVVARGEAAGVGDVAQGVGQVLHDLPDGQQPDQHFEEAQQRSQPPHPLGDGDQPDGPDADVGDARQEYQDGQNDPGEYAGTQEA